MHFIYFLFNFKSEGQGNYQRQGIELGLMC